MRSLRYLNTMLTILAVLLALQLWTTWTMSDALSAGAATVQAAPAPAQEGGVANAGAQRREMIDLLKRLTEQAEENKELFVSGRARVTIEAGNN
jgi:parvulin-like peptidyl-prolyl isomerase